MLKTEAILEIKKGDRVYKMFLPADAPLGETFDVNCEIRAYLIQRMSEVQNADKPKPEETPKE